MPMFQYEAMDKTGTEVKDSIEAQTEADAQQLIRDQGYFVTRIQEKGRAKKKKSPQDKKKAKGPKRTFTIGGVRPKDLTTFTRQLSTLQDAGLPILRSLKILEGQAKPGPLKNSLLGVVDDIESGSTLSEAMAKQPKAFDSLYVNMVKAGEASGALEIILRRLAEFKERSESLKRKVKGAMIYPGAVVTVAVLIVGFIMYYIIPKFRCRIARYHCHSHGSQRFRRQLLVPRTDDSDRVLFALQDHQEEQNRGLHCGHALFEDTHFGEDIK
jgi:type IV pilus assembly protein PilC